MLLLSLTEFAKYLGVSDPLQYASIAFAMNNLVNLIGNVTSVFTTLSWPPAPHWVLSYPNGYPVAPYVSGASLDASTAYFEFCII